MSAVFHKNVCPVFDIIYDISCGPHDPDTVDEKMRLTREAGFQKIYLVAQQDDYSAWQKDLPTIPADGRTHYCFESMLNLGDPWFQYIRFARKHGLKVIVRFKPYESGGAYSLPAGAKPLFPYNTMEQLGGCGYGYPRFIYKHPEMRVRRLNYRKEERSITAAEFVFFAESVTYRSRVDGKETTLPPAEELKRPMKNIQLFQSRDNGRYEPLNATCREFYEKRMIRRMDGSGRALFPEPVLCRVIRFEGLDLPQEVAYLGFKADNLGEFHTLPYTMTCLYHGDERMECTATVIPRMRAFLLDNREFIGDGPLDFRKNGFEFESIESIFWGDGILQTDEGIGVARGKMEYMKGILCEGYPEVRAYWLRRIQEFIDMGADGVSIRFRCHSGSVLDFAAWGGNDVLLKRYQERYGDTAQIDPEKMMRVRGSYFLEFYEQAAELLHRNGKTLECDGNLDFAEPHMDHDYNHVGFWTMPKVLPDYRRLTELSDSVSFNDYNFGHYDPDYGKKFKDYAAFCGKPCQIHCYLQQGGELSEEFLSAVQADPRITGVELYEMVCNRMHGYGKQELRGYFAVDRDCSVQINTPVAEQVEKLTGIRQRAASGVSA